MRLHYYWETFLDYLELVTWNRRQKRNKRRVRR
jgi:hypothetical protein